MASILIVDDNESVLNSLELYLKYKFDEVITLKNPGQILTTVRQKDIDVVLLDMNFTAGVNTGNEGFYWLKRIKEADEDIVVVLFTAYGDVELAVRGMKEGATDFVLKPWDNKKLHATLQSAVALRESRREIKKLKETQSTLKKDSRKHFEMFRGNSQKMKKVYDLVDKVAITNANVLILGENGTGKELIAREIHEKSNRREQPFISVDLGSISESLFESEMFGHVKGAFTDAKENKPGRFKVASGGTLFLDEVGNIPLSLQAKLLRAIETKIIVPVGDTKEIRVDIRLIAATNKNLSAMAEEGTFREDLLYRLNTIQVDLPPLRERDNDLVQLAEYFTRKYSLKYNKTGLNLDMGAREKLKEYNWPGNIRELKHAVERAVILADEEIIGPSSFSFKPASAEVFRKNGKFSLEDGERMLIAGALEYNNWNISDTARQLNIGRQTLYRKMERYDIKKLN